MEKVPEGNEEIEQLGDMLEIQKLTDSVKDISDRASEITKQLDNPALSQEERQQLEQELDVCVKKGAEVGQKRTEIFGKYPPV